MKKLSEIMLPVPIDSGFKMEGYWVWCGSVIKAEDGKYHMFASRWPKTLPMHPGWLLKSEIVRAVSDTPWGPYEFREVVLPQRGPQYWDGCATHCPRIKKVDDMYVLYYMGTRYITEFCDDEVSLDHPSVIYARASKRIGVAYSKSIYGPWQRGNTPLLDTRPESFDSYFTSNPAPCIKDNGEIFMLYKSREYVEPEENPYRFGKMKILLAESKDIYSPFSRKENNLLFEGLPYEMEDPFVWYDGGYHMIAKDMTGKICGEMHAGVHAFSADGVHWSVDREPFYSRSVLFEDGRTIVLGSMERPFILFEDNIPICAFFAVSDGTDGLGFINCKNTWNMAVPLKC